ncbi:alcohol dehydrogenase catalytic domain-containing protein [Reichenbachiella carrageenanivorans]|uniref:Alcohol dehydrogenase catalytic domain-containing protein n=1 Tax=Reichenbachiella carrageenanivorans TaxID=2979869 RepID=A0ABY6CWU2_9BACT|nr:alcohol dehydrogenase catalytic domain-containing protein [Reichenbachiella carrageenanivorans]UXX77850.1 alcohol dehydrogenase catalytic domain-containing protein [Reichenbachiella carrageenanivorans]
MKAAYYKEKGVFEIGEGQQIAPQAGEVRLDVAYCGVCGTDVHIYHGVMDARVKPPMTVGHEASATVAALGEGVTNVKVGDKVAVRPLHFGSAHPFDKGYAHVGKNLKFIGIDSQGAFQNSWTVPAYTLHKLPENLSLKHGAFVEPLAVACHDVKIGRVAAGENTLVIGGGPIGTLIAYVLKEKGAHVIISEVNENRLKMLNDLGFTTINPAKENLVDRISELTDEKMIDCAFEVSGSAPGVDAMTQVVNVRGRIVMVAIHGGEKKPVDLFKFFWSEIELLGARLYEEDDYEEAIRIAASGQIPFEQLITKIDTLDNIQSIFETIDNNPAGMKYLIDCQQ